MTRLIGRAEPRAPDERARATHASATAAVVSEIASLWPIGQAAQPRAF
jgi:hypothetical protein